MIKKSLTFAFIFSSIVLFAQKKTENIFVITMDGFRWQEVFTGADSNLLANKKYTHNEVTAKKYWDANPINRRKILMPFFWDSIVKNGTLIGNRAYQNNMNVTNKIRLSFPGYSELFTGYVDSSIIGNQAVINKNENVFAFLNKQAKYQDKVVAFASWNLFPYILNEKKSNFMVNSGFEDLKLEGNPTVAKEIELINQLANETPRFFGEERLDVFTWQLARRYIETKTPKVTYLSFGDTDEFAHEGEYDRYLNSAQQIDVYLKELFRLIQNHPQYKNKTTVIITCDHGRGSVEQASDWTSHNATIVGADEMWMCAIGPDLKPMGEVKTAGQHYQKQLAQTIANMLGETFKTDHPVAEPISLFLGR